MKGVIARVDRAGAKRGGMEIVYEVSIGGNRAEIRSGERVRRQEWDEERGMPCVSESSGRYLEVMRIRERVQLDIARIAKVAKALRRRGIHDAESITEKVREYERRLSLSRYVGDLVVRMRRAGRERCGETYQATERSIRKYCQGRELPLDCITSHFAEGYEGWLREQGLSPNTTSFYMRILRAVYNRAADEGLVSGERVFKRVYTGVDKTMKRSLTLAQIGRIKSADLSGQPKLEFARDMFMLSFYLRGMSFVDMSFLRKSDLRNGYVVYRRRKTGQQLAVKWMPEMQRILDRYGANSSKYLLPIIRKATGDERGAYQRCYYSVNRGLKQLAQRLDLPIKLTLYVARHSWASGARAKGIPLSVISEGMGHSSEKTTRIYLSSLDAKVIDQANALLLASL